MSEIVYPYGDTLPDPGAAMEIAAGVRWVRMPLPYALNHINLWLVENGEGTWCAVDTGMDMGDVKAHWQALIAQYPLSRQIVTHYHPDHLGLSAWLQAQTGAPLAMTQGEYLTAQAFANEIGEYSPQATGELFRRHGLGPERLQALAERGNAYRRAVPQIPATYTVLRNGEKVRIGAHDWRVIVGTGHSPEHACYHCPELKLLISGDQVLPRISSNVSVHPTEPDENPMADWLASLAKIKAQVPDDVLVLPAHNEVFRGLHARLDYLAATQLRTLARLRKSLTEPRRTVDVFGALFARAIGENDAGLLNLAA